MKVTALLAAGGAAWEPEALRIFERTPSRLVLLKRCMDLNDLLASALSGAASVAVVDAGVAGLDADSVAVLRRAGLSVVVVADASGAARVSRLGVDTVLAADELTALPGVLEGAVPVVVPDEPELLPAHSGRLVAVWGPSGAPGRTTVAVALAAELAHRGDSTLLLDADPYGGAVAQHLGVLDQVSGLLAAARLANAGQLDIERLSAAARRVGDNLRVLSGLPRADRWVEVRSSAYDELLTVATALEPTVVADTGFCLEHDPDALLSSTGRNAMTLTTLQRADAVVVVGAADPVGLTRLVRGLHDLADLLPGVRPVVAVNRMRASLGWTEREVLSTVEQVAPGSPVVFLPEDRAAVDRALMAGRTLVEGGDSSLRTAVAELCQALRSRYKPVTV